MKRSHPIKYSIAAYTDAAGKSTPGAVRSGNEDNFYVCPDLSRPQESIPPADGVVSLGEFGLLMCVADGMGGANAGEVASQIAVDTVAEACAQREEVADAARSVHSRERFLEGLVRKADKAIKAEAAADKEKAGMGSTIVLAWLLGAELTVTWCGDSRLYLYNDRSGIRLITRDHSYVQELVDRGLLTYDQTFDHPQNNIITRSLGDPSGAARPESRTLRVGRGDLVLICSDGLSGVLRDRKTFDAYGHLCPEGNIEDILRQYHGDLRACRQALWRAAEQNGWYDNVTAILCRIEDGPQSEWGTTAQDASKTVAPGKAPRKIPFWVWTLGAICLGAILAISFLLGRRSGESTVREDDSARVDMISEVPDDAPADANNDEDAFCLPGDGADIEYGDEDKSQKSTNREPSSKGSEGSNKLPTAQSIEDAAMKVGNGSSEPAHETPAEETSKGRPSPKKLTPNDRKEGGEKSGKRLNETTKSESAK